LNDTLKKLQVLGRAQAAVIRAQLRRSVQKLVVVAVGLVFTLLALAALNYAALAALQEHLSAAQSGLVLGLFDLLVGALLFAKGLAEHPPGEEELLAREITEMATDGLSADFDEARQEVRDFMRDTRQMGQVIHQVASIIGGPVAQVIKVIFGLWPRSGSK